MSVSTEYRESARYKGQKIVSQIIQKMPVFLPNTAVHVSAVKPNILKHHDALHSHENSMGSTRTEGVHIVLKFSANKFAGNRTKTYTGDARKKTFHSLQRQHERTHIIVPLVLSAFCERCSDLSRLMTRATGQPLEMQNPENIVV